MIARKLFCLSTLIVAILAPVASPAQTDSAHWDYIRRYTTAAVAEMYYSKIPASITMAQALHESRYGTSELAVKANNHFGIKCQTGWSGQTYTYQDDDANTCFRKYDSVAQSYRDHSNFLMTRPRYADLFKLDPYDYAGWAHGLKKAGYATNPNYAPILIKLIEDYRLYLLDEKQPPLEAIVAQSGARIPQKTKEAAALDSKVFHRNRIRYYIAGPGDNIESVTKRFHMLKWEIRKYNEIPKYQDIVPGQLLYLQPKRIHAESAYHTHRVEKGENMYTISQLYGIKLKCLYYRNRMKPGTQPNVGQDVWLRGMKPKPAEG